MISLCHAADLLKGYYLDPKFYNPRAPVDTWPVRANVATIVRSIALFQVNSFIDSELGYTNFWRPIPASARKK